MSGILDNKSRIIDAILTVEGRRQMAEGTFEVSYATFSDAGVAYIPDTENGHDDPTRKIYIEACNLPQDQITFEANDEGKLVAFRNQDIKLKTPGKNVPTAISEGSMINGRLTVYQRYHGRRVKTEFIQSNVGDLGKGFVYADSTGLTGSILIDPYLKAGQIKVSSSVSPPTVAYVGTNGGLGPQEFAQALSGAISQLSGSVGGPKASVSAVNDSIYIDINESFVGSKLYAVGTLSSPLLIEEGAIGGRLLTDELENASFASQIQGILTSSFDNFTELQTLASINRLFQDQNFSLSTGSIDFNLSSVTNKNVVVNEKGSPYPSLNSIDSIFNDDKLSNLENFLYLPPIIKTPDSIAPDKTDVANLKPYLLGDYPSWGDNEKRLTFKKLMTQLQDFEDFKQKVLFTETSTNNRLICQFFEVTDQTVSKLDVVDFGFIMNDAQEETAITNRVFFVGKTYLDNRGTTCFVNMFTLIFSKLTESEKEMVR